MYQQENEKLGFFGTISAVLNTQHPKTAFAAFVGFAGSIVPITLLALGKMPPCGNPNNDFSAKLCEGHPTEIITCVLSSAVANTLLYMLAVVSQKCRTPSATQNQNPATQEAPRIPRTASDTSLLSEAQLTLLGEKPPEVVAQP